MEDKALDIEKLLAEKVEIERILKSHFSKTVAVMFTDIKGSTSFYELRGDIEGRAMVHQHDQIVIPEITRHGGALVKTIGDATLSLFEDPSDALRSAMAIQKALDGYNLDKAETDQIHVKIGLNYGTGIVQPDDIYGDVVNVASRLVSTARAGDIVLPQEFYRKVKGNDEFIFRYIGRMEVKGKHEPLDTYRLLWREEELFIKKLRGKAETPPGQEGYFHLEVSQSGRTLKVRGYEKDGAEVLTIKQYKETEYNEQSAKECTRGILELLSTANKGAKVGNELLMRLKEYGKRLHDDLIPPQVRENLVSTRRREITLSIDDTLVHIPWELLYDGKEFLCRRFRMGRIVSTRQPVSVAARAVGRPLKMQILADPCGDLAASYREGVAIKSAIGDLDDRIDLSLKTSDIRKDYVAAKIRNFDVVHYAGHAEHNPSDPGQSGLVLKDGRLTAEEIMNLKGSAPMPSLIFSNACQTGQTEEWRIDEDYVSKVFGLANAFLLTGVQHYIGTFWQILDEAGCHFAISFYKSLMNGFTIGEALGGARESLIEKYGEGNIVWASYMLYGNPSTRYVEPEVETSLIEPSGNEETASSLGGLRAKPDASQSPRRSRHLPLWIGGIAAAILILMAVLFIRGERMGEGEKRGPGTGIREVSKEKESGGQKIDELITALAQRYREGKLEEKEGEDDAWSSRPLTLVFMDIKDHGGDQERGERLSSLLAQALQNDARMKAVERQFLMKLLAELKLGSSALADPAASLKLGRLLSARIIIFGSIAPEGKGQAITLRCIDTETTLVRKVINVSGFGKEIDPDSIRNIAAQISEWTRADFPLQGKVLSVSGDHCTVNLGQIHGLKKGDALEVISDHTKGAEGDEGTADLRIETVEKDTSDAIISKKGGKILKGNRVRERKG